MLPRRKKLLTFVIVINFLIEPLSTASLPTFTSSELASFDVNLTISLPSHLILGKLETASRTIVAGSPGIPFPESVNALTRPQVDMDENLAQKLTLEIKAGLRYVLQTENNVTLCVHGTGSTALEAVMDNVIEPGDRVLIPSYGVWGEHAADDASRFGAETVIVRKERGKTFAPKEV